MAAGAGRRHRRAAMVQGAAQKPKAGKLPARHCGGAREGAHALLPTFETKLLQIMLLLAANPICPPSSKYVTTSSDAAAWCELHLLCLRLLWPVGAGSGLASHLRSLIRRHA